MAGLLEPDAGVGGGAAEQVQQRYGQHGEAQGEAEQQPACGGCGPRAVRRAAGAGRRRRARGWAGSWAPRQIHSPAGSAAHRGGTPTATPLARLGDDQPLLDFIDRAIVDDDVAETANLNYWAYRLGAIREPQPNDGFMRGRPTDWEPVRLLRGLVSGLYQAPGYAGLYIHSLWALLTAHRWLPLAAPDLTKQLSARIEQLLGDSRISPRSRQDLSSVHYVLREDHT